MVLNPRKEGVRGNNRTTRTGARMWVMPVDASALHFENPRTDAAKELNRLLARRAEVAAMLGDAERAGRFASEAAQVASSELAALERRRLGGDDMDAAIRRAEKRLAVARGDAAQPWSERVSGGRAALRDADSAIARHVSAHFDALAGELEEDGRAVADRADSLLHELGAVYAEREATVARWTALITAGDGRVRPGTIPYSKLEPVAREAERVLMAGGEVAPAPRQPIHGAPA